MSHSPDDDAEYHDEPERGDRRAWTVLAVMLAGMVAAVLVGPSLVDGVSNRLEQPEVQSLGTAPNSDTDIAVAAAPVDPDDADRLTAADDQTGTDGQPDTTVATTSTSVASTSTTVAPTATTAATTATTAATTATTAATTATTAAMTATESEPPPGRPTPSTTTDADDGQAAFAPLQTIQLVPALRDVIVEVDGEPKVSDRNGFIDLGEYADDAEFRFVGIVAQPSLRAVAFGRWSDGNLDAQRPLAEVAGPVSQLGIVVNHRVTVTSRDEVAPDALLDFESAAGPVQLRVGRTAWVPAQRAVESPDGLVVEPLAYTVSRLVVDATVRELSPQEFEPRPEALWVVGTDVSG